MNLKKLLIKRAPLITNLLFIIETYLSLIEWSENDILFVIFGPMLPLVFLTYIEYTKSEDEDNKAFWEILFTICIFISNLLIGFIPYEGYIIGHYTIANIVYDKHMYGIWFIIIPYVIYGIFLLIFSIRKQNQ